MVLFGISRNGFFITLLELGALDQLVYRQFYEGKVLKFSILNL